MTQEERELLLKDLCARLPYKVKVEHIFITENNGYMCEMSTHTILLISNNEWLVRPYLRPMSSMTEEENKQRKELSILLWYNSNGERGFDGFGEISGEDVLKAVDWLNEHHFDYRGLIEKGLALEAPKGMYKID